jgi:hypothetical protein
MSRYAPSTAPGSLPTPGIKNVVIQLETAAASILREGCSHRAGLDLRLEVSDQRFVPLRFPVYGVLQPLHEPLKVRDTRFEQRHTIIACSDGRALVRSIRAGTRAADLADSREQSVTLSHDHRLPDRLGGTLRGA